MFVNVAPNSGNIEETLCSLNFANRVRNTSLGKATKNIVRKNSGKTLSNSNYGSEDQSQSVSENIGDIYNSYNVNSNVNTYTNNDFNTNNNNNNYHFKQKPRKITGIHF